MAENHLMERVGWLALMLVTFGVAGFLLKIVGTRLDNSSGALGIVVGYVIAGTIFGLGGGGRLGLSWAYVGAAAIGAAYIIGNWAFLRLAHTEEISVLAPLANLSIVVPIVLGVLLLGESFTIRKLLGIAFALVAVILLA